MGCHRTLATVTCTHMYSYMGMFTLVLTVSLCGTRLLRPATVVKVILPDPSSPVRMPVISVPQSSTHTPPTPSSTAEGVRQPTQPLTNGISDSPPSASAASSSPNCFKTPKTPAPRTPLTPQASLPPSAYKYVVELEEELQAIMTVNSRQLR